MKRIKKTVSVLLALIMIGGIAPLGAANLITEASAKTIEEYSAGDVINYGSYPQSKVIDSATISALDAMDKTWISYGYYSGAYYYDEEAEEATDDEINGKMKPSDYMKYCDISYNGNKYRAVLFSSYRPFHTAYISSASYSDQYNNGYYTDNVYYFKYEPLTWRVLDPSESFVMCEKAIDSQAYNNYVYYDSIEDEYYGNSAKTYYASDWENSSLRAWLNNDFYNTAFNSYEKLQIGTTYNDNKSTYSSKYDYANTSDKIFLLSYDEVLNTKYGFSSNTSTYDKARQVKTTDYAQCQGCTNSDDTGFLGNAWWRLRSPEDSYSAAEVSCDGDVYRGYDVCCVNYGIVPTFKFNPKSIICDEHSYKSTVTLQPTCMNEGIKAYTCSVCSDSYTEKIDALGHDFGEWKTTTPATCTDDGVETGYCSRCDAFETREIKATGHIDGEWKITKPATYTTEGEKTLYCKECGAEIRTETIPVMQGRVISVSISNVEIKYKKSATIKPEIKTEGNVKYTVKYETSDQKIVTVDQNGNITTKHKGTADITCLVLDEAGNVLAKDTKTINVKFSFGQWLIWIFLLGFLWY